MLRQQNAVAIFSVCVCEGVATSTSQAVQNVPAGKNRFGEIEAMEAIEKWTLFCTQLYLRRFVARSCT